MTPIDKVLPDNLKQYGPKLSGLLLLGALAAVYGIKRRSKDDQQKMLERYYEQFGKGNFRTRRWAK